MDLGKYTRTVEKAIVDNSPAILTGVGVIGTVVTAVLTHKATFKSTLELTQRDSVKKMKGEPPLTRTEIIKHTWVNYLPPVASGTITILSIVGAHRVSTKRMAALAAGYTLLDGRFEEYKDKMREKLGLKKEEDARTDIAYNRVHDNPPPATLIVSEGKSLFKDEPSGRYFESTMEEIKRAMNAINYKLLSDEWAALSDFYMEIGLEPTSLSEEYGWDISTQKMDVAFTAVIAPDQRPCICMDYNVHPIRNGYSKARTS